MAGEGAQTAELMNLDPNIWEPLRTAALMRGIGRVTQAKLVRDVFP